MFSLLLSHGGGVEFNIWGDTNGRHVKNFGHTVVSQHSGGSPGKFVVITYSGAIKVAP